MIFPRFFSCLQSVVRESILALELEEEEDDNVSGDGHFSTIAHFLHRPLFQSPHKIAFELFMFKNYIPLP